MSKVKAVFGTCKKLSQAQVFKSEYMAQGCLLQNYTQQRFYSEPFSYDPPGTNHLFVPGPVNMHEKVRQAMNVPNQNNRDPWFPPFYKNVVESLKYIFKTEKGQTFIIPGTGTGGWESALNNTLSPGDKVVTFRKGQFSHLWIDMMQRMGLEVEAIDLRWGDGIPEDKLGEILKKDTGKKIKAVAVVHNETTTGVTSDLKQIRKAIDDSSHPALFLVDGVSSIGALPFYFDDWKVDVAVTGSQKALSLPTGLGLLAVSPKALEARKTSKANKTYFDWEDWSKTFPATPYTPIIPTLWGLKKSIEILKEEGLENVWARHHRLAEGTRQAAAGWGLSLLVKDPRWNSDSLTVLEVPEGVDSNKIVKTAFAKYNLSIGIGLSKLNGKVFRIGHLGNMDELMLAGAISGVEMCLIENGVKFAPGAGIGRAVKYWQETSKVIPTREVLLQ